MTHDAWAPVWWLMGAWFGWEMRDLFRAWREYRAEARKAQAVAEFEAAKEET